MNTAEKIYELVQDLPTFRQMEVLDFTHYLAQRERPTAQTKSGFQQFAGVLKESEVFAGDPVAIQESLRNIMAL